jgi:hypothetical protein
MKAERERERERSSLLVWKDIESWNTKITEKRKIEDGAAGDDDEMRDTTNTRQ